MLQETSAPNATDSFQKCISVAQNATISCAQRADIIIRVETFRGLTCQMFNLYVEPMWQNERWGMHNEKKNAGT